MSRLDLASPATRAALQRLLDHPDVQELHIGKPASAEQPVEVGVVRRSTLRASWHWGATLGNALARAEDGLRPRDTGEVGHE